MYQFYQITGEAEITNLNGDYINFTGLSKSQVKNMLA